MNPLTRSIFVLHRSEPVPKQGNVGTFELPEFCSRARILLGGVIPPEL